MIFAFMRSMSKDYKALMKRVAKIIEI